MKPSLMIVCLFPLALGCAAPALAQTAAAPPVVQSTPTPESANAGYIESATADLAIWRQKIADFNARVGTSATQASLDAKQELATAGSALASSHAALATASAADWDRTKTAYENAKLALEAKWATLVAPKT